MPRLDWRLQECIQEEQTTDLKGKPPPAPRAQAFAASQCLKIKGEGGLQIKTSTLTLTQLKGAFPHPHVINICKHRVHTVSISAFFSFLKYQGDRCISCLWMIVLGLLNPRWIPTAESCREMYKDCAQHLGSTAPACRHASKIFATGNIRSWSSVWKRTKASEVLCLSFHSLCVPKATDPSTFPNHRYCSHYHTLDSDGPSPPSTLAPKLRPDFPLVIE